MEPLAPSSGIYRLNPIEFYPTESVAVNDKGNAFRRRVVPKGEVAGYKLRKVGDRKIQGLGYKDAVQANPRYGSPDGESIDWNAITADLVLEVQRLEERVAQLESLLN